MPAENPPAPIVVSYYCYRCLRPETAEYLAAGRWLLLEPCACRDSRELTDDLS